MKRALLLGGLLAISLLMWSSTCRAQPATPSLSIVSPNSGISVSPGQSITISVTGSNLPSGGIEAVVGRDPLGASATQPAGTNLQFTITVPETISPGSYDITAVESDPSAGLIQSAPITIVVQATYALTSLAITDSPLLLNGPGDQMPLNILVDRNT